MAAIYVLSDQSDLSSGLGTADLVLRKIAHMVEYGLLWILWLRAFGYRRAAAAAVIAIAYAASDEWHQSTVEGRVGSPVDVGIDALGVLIAWVAWSRWRDRRRQP